MPTEELEAWLQLIRCAGLGGAAIVGLVEEFGSAAAAIAAGKSAWKRRGASDEACRNLSCPDPARLQADLDWCAGPRRGLITWSDPRYPSRLRDIASAPPALFFRGDVDLLGLPQLAIVGSRNATPQGLETAGEFAAELARRGLVICSGLALGIDGAAHRGALAAGGMTVAVCGTGLDRAYPAQHKGLAEEIDRAGLLVSEFAPGTPPRAENFPRRNRLIAGLSLGVLVVEAARESGSLITARLAAEQGREVFAIPGSIHNVMSRGCHQLIRNGAKLVETAADVLEELGPQVGAWLRSQRGTMPEPAPGTVPAPRHQALVEALGDHPMGVDSLVEKLGLGVDAVNTALIELELDGQVATLPGGRVMRLHRA
jgi:DNA processing protein